MIINISKALKLSLVFAVCAGQGVYADQTRAMDFAKNFVRVLPADQAAIMAAGLYGAIGGLYQARKDNWINKVRCVGIGTVTTLGASILLNRQNPELPATGFGFTGGALNFLGAQNFNQCLVYGALTVGCGFANPVLREMITQHPKLAAGFVGAAFLGKVAPARLKEVVRMCRVKRQSRRAEKFNIAETARQAIER